MASGNTLAIWTPKSNMPPASAYATLNTRNGHEVLEFINGSTISAIFGGVLPRNYAGGGVTLTIIWMAVPTAGNVVWGAAIERHQALTDDLSADSFGGEKTTTEAAPGTTGQVRYSTLAFTNGAEMDSLAAAESFRLKIRRITGGADTMAGIAQLLRLELKET